MTDLLVVLVSEKTMAASAHLMVDYCEQTVRSLSMELQFELHMKVTRRTIHRSIIDEGRNFVPTEP